MFGRLLLMVAAGCLAAGVLTCSHEELTLTADVPASYTYRLPADYDSTEEYPLVVALHGRDQDESQMTKLWDDGFFYDPNFILLSIRAPFRTRNGYGWISENAANPTGDPDAVLRASARLADERITDAIDSFSDQYSVDDVEIYVMGFAQAAPLVFYSAFKHPDVFAGVAVESGNLDSILNPPKSLRQAQYLDFYLSVGRDEDPNLVQSVQQTGEVLSGLGADVDVNVHDGGRVITWQSCRRMQNTFDLSNGEAPEDDFNGPGGGGIGPGDDDGTSFGDEETARPDLTRLLAAAR